MRKWEWLGHTMETCSRRLPLPVLAAGQPLASSFHGHGTCREGVVPSGLRKPQQPERGVERVGINYDKLRELCLHGKDEGEDADAREQRHRQFMSSYQLLLQREPAGHAAGKTSLKRRYHTCTGKNLQSHLQREPAGHAAGKTYLKRRYHTCTVPVGHSHHVASYIGAIHGKTATQTTIDTNSRLRAIHKILRKLPLERDAGEVKQLSNHLSHFPSLLPTSGRATPKVLVGVAARCILEIIPKKGFSLPDKGGVYLILQGSVERKTKDDETHKITSIQLYEGDSFGAMEEGLLTKLCYPMYVTSSRCALMRISVQDYKRVLQNCEEAERRERLGLTSSCPALAGVSGAITAALASDLQWDTLPPNTILLEEGETISRVGFIQSGNCKASMEVPHTNPRAQLVIGRLGPGSCVGEALLRGSERQPYQVATATRVKIGWVPSTTITMNEVKKLIPAERELCIPVPSKEMVRYKYAQELVGQNWRKIKSDVLSEVRCKQPLLPEPTRWKM